MEKTEGRATNGLIHSTSPYLQQHAHNPVQWNAWSSEALTSAQQQDKLIIISIGYSACHWCHVMERESFEDDEVARIMNKYYINIKVDREERPDIDYVYMAAVQLMTGRGGWPLNCIALPDGRPIFGGTYFTKKQWTEALLQIAEYYLRDKAKCIEYAESLTNGVAQNESQFVKSTDSSDIDFIPLNNGLKKWMNQWDSVYGGNAHAPKFPMPGNYIFLMLYGHMQKHVGATSHAVLTLRQMSNGGIYDHVGGGFARYATDVYWKVPHFEKMLYDNAQLIQLFALAYYLYGNLHYANVIHHTIDFLHRELLAENGGYCTALDADTEGEEGKFYVWTKAQLQHALQHDFDKWSTYYEINDKGLWEHNNYVLMRNTVAVPEREQQWLTACNNKLLATRAQRIRPGLDDKQLLGCNAMTITGLVTSYMVTVNNKYLIAAIDCWHFIQQHLHKGNNHYYHTYTKGIASIDAFADDYALMIDALVNLYHATLQGQYMQQALALMEHVMQHFYNSTSGLFNFMAKSSEPLYASKYEMHDNVTPASNAVLAKNLFTIGRYFGLQHFVEMSTNMLKMVQDDLTNYLPAFTTWGILQMWIAGSYYDVIVYGENAAPKAHTMRAAALVNALIIVGNEQSNAPHFEGKQYVDDAWIYICDNEKCLAPTTLVSEAMKWLDMPATIE